MESIEPMTMGETIEEIIFDSAVDLLSVDSTAMKTFSIRSVGSKRKDQNRQCHVIHEGAFTSIYCSHDPVNKFGGCAGSVAIKSLNQMYSGGKHVSRLENEYAFLRLLSPQCSSVRAPITRSEFDGRPALLLEWVTGITLRKWINLIHKNRIMPPLAAKSMSTIPPEDNTKTILQLACVVSRALAEIHSARAIHNNLNPDNIIVDNSNNAENVQVKVIGFGSATLLFGLSEKSFRIQTDLISLGSIIFEMFTGICPFKEDYSEISFSEEKKANQNKRLLSRNQLLSILVERVPLDIAKLILNLMGAGEPKPCYQSASDVCNELCNLLLNLDCIMSMFDSEKGISRLRFTKSKLYGQDSNMSKLLDACRKVGQPSGARMVLVSGYSGMGKSAIVEHVKKATKKERVQFISGKFDQLQQAAPLSAVEAALNEYTKSIVQQGPQSIYETKKTVTEAIDTEVGVLTEVFPCLCEIIGTPKTAPIEISSMAAQNRFKFVFQMFFRAITASSRPFYLFLDDLQWADDLSLQLLHSLVTDIEIKNFLFIGSYRSNEVNPGHPLSVHLNEIKSKDIPIVDIIVSSMSKEDVNKLISDTIKMPPEISWPFSSTVYKKTSGNPLFVTQFLLSLWDEGSLFFSLESKTWKWDLDAVEAKQIVDDVGMLMSEKILQLPLECQDAMKLLACIGSKCDESTLELFLNKGKCIRGEIHAKKRKRSAGNISQFSMLDLAVEEGLLKKEGLYYLFVHDQIQHAAYSLIPENDRGLLHKYIGSLILDNVAEKNIVEVLFTVVTQLNRGKMFIPKNQREDLAMLNLKAGEKSMSLATFLNAASYLKAGISVLCEDHWEKKYELTLQLYSLYAEAQYCNGRFQEVKHIADIVIRQAKKIEDKLRVFATLVKSLEAQKKLQDALELGSDVLTDLGLQVLSPLPDKDAVLRDIMKTKQILEETSDTEFLSYKEMSDSKIIVTMEFLQILLTCAFFGNQQYLPIIVNQMMQLTLCHGVCKVSCVALVSLSNMLCEFEDFEASSHIGHLAILLLEKFKTEEYLSQVYSLYFNGIRSWNRHIKLNLESLMRGYQVGIQTGDIKHAMLDAYLYLLHSLLCGRSLTKLEREIDMFRKEMIEYKQVMMSHLVCSLQKVVSYLVGSTGYPSSTVTQFQNQKGKSADAIKGNNATAAALFCIFAGIEAYIFCEYELAYEIVQRRREIEQKMSRKSKFYGTTDFYDGLIYLAMSRTRDEFTWSFGANNVISKLEKYTRIQESNCKHKLLLLQAEVKSRMGENKAAAHLYELAIDAAEQSDFTHEHAIASERAGDFYLRNNDERASQYYGKAHALYLQWGAQGKADHLCRKIPF